VSVRRGVRAALAATAAALAASWATAQPWPARPIRMISPNPAGGANDTVGRLAAARVADILGAQIVVDNRGGAGGTIGAELAARAAPDGYTLLAASVSTHAFAPIIHRKLGYDPLRDFTPISLFAIAQNLLVVHPSVPVSNAQQLVALARAKPGTLNYASAGGGSTSHFAVSLFVGLTGIVKTTVHVPYKGGAPALAATMAGEAQFYFGPMPGMTPHVASGRVRALAVGGTKRSPVLPEVPTMAEAGFPAYQSQGWFGLVAPAGTPAPIVTRLNRAVVEAMNAPDMAQKLTAIGVDAASDTPERFDRFIRDQLELHRRIVAEVGIRFD